jgi:hypothetical protein
MTESSPLVAIVVEVGLAVLTTRDVAQPILPVGAVGAGLRHDVKLAAKVEQATSPGDP